MDATFGQSTVVRQTKYGFVMRLDDESEAGPEVFVYVGMGPYGPSVHFHATDPGEQPENAWLDSLGMVEVDYFKSRLRVLSWGQADDKEEEPTTKTLLVENVSAAMGVVDAAA